MIPFRQTAMAFACVLTLSACGQNGEAPPIDNWEGRWTGVEGTYLDIRKAPQDGAYEVAIRDLDAERTFTATASGNGLKFTRDNVEENITAGNGEQTGMKWLTDKKDCLVIKTGEGYCRD
ncbi:MAG: hypothetical protein DI626_00995 [Micavibrio aeruginosavorus]|uniref:Lipoprotein n=1 Tax=Micavibrio aeruginosavorus TaxID=349221 RepID=A0A2W5C0G1_9BACT|nr:MAG: hypothetical protein DI626_00995 [Micavibrio aeruginosavorus]